jgi:hypothetical protein
MSCSSVGGVNVLKGGHREKMRGGEGCDVPSIGLAGRRYFLQMKAMLTMIMTARYTIEDMDSGVQMLGWSEVDMMWPNK